MDRETAAAVASWAEFIVEELPSVETPPWTGKGDPLLFGPTY